ncbi:hypothetical protein ERO13_A11G305600v2 [Gossypium hirsutum]|uniref:Calmodulin-binding protein 25 n=3 Tax=Gossypium TaxID=3633 RepID=A0ABM2Z7I7_GOSHI|nr:calmodulin-binding protein 25-like [Gossypium hirsutum]KAG4177426.1 hypothetical protein ERO13_A11G305600v2 [Gossypium hirsutum]TYG96613.1 hypothetical protein ES288_A11G365200v1 [Gossypium darwinii]TYI03793.1 hypothetical protein ES332_A11G366200v1 [Gossypium tomentosum]
MAASSENLSTFETSPFHCLLTDPWIAESFSRDTQVLTRALQKSISDSITDPIVLPAPEPAPKRYRTAGPSPTGKISKRKPRASKSSRTTFIAADPANFRQMVQQVTGIGFGEGKTTTTTVSPILKPEPQRLGNRLHNGAGPGFLPTLDTSVALLNHQQPCFETFPSFPTLESWKV